ncbi:hypothetical protein X798_03194 [Onchocerca flexuosa]|uniref:Uncharacterized protein n=1 Tax=Onchocerca flexuosa TaxID=387005 RepID=A0A238BWV4_9BILA|nr:hypothetical protein X798_03194 [Onchocerca flexuosa]
MVPMPAHAKILGCFFLRNCGVMMMTLCGPDLITVQSIDMVRSFALEDTNMKKIQLRKSWKWILLRGRLGYCSPNVHRCIEQLLMPYLFVLQ